MRNARLYHSRRGNTLLTAAILLPALFAIISLCVDFGRVQVAKCKMQTGTDAAARYAVTGLSDSSTLTKANAIGAAYQIEGGTLTFQAGDIEAGTWNSTTRAFSTGGSSPNAVRVTARRTTARGNAIPLLFARLIGATSCDVVTTAIAKSASATSYGVVGLDTVNMDSDAKIIGYNSATSDATEIASATVGGNGNWNLNSNAKIHGNAYYRTSSPNASKVTGTRTQLSSNLSYAMPTTPGGTTNMGNYSRNSGTHTFTDGSYYFTDLNLDGNAVIQISGNAKFYINGNFSMNSNAIMRSSSTPSRPQSLEIYMVASAGVNLDSNAELRAVVYAPGSPLNINSNGVLRGSVIAKSISMSSNAKIMQDLSLTDGSGGSSGIVMVD